MALSDLTVRQAKAAEKAYSLPDTDGLGLVVAPTGGKSWHLRYYWLGKLAASIDAMHRRTSAELAGWMPPSLSLGWLDGLADDEDAAVRSAALGAIRSRRLEAAAMDHLRAMASSPKPLKWARLQTVFEIVDPRFLWSRDDPASLSPFLDASEYEFFVESQKLYDKRAKAMADTEKKADDKER